MKRATLLLALAACTSPPADPTTTPPATCGNGMLDADETCDGAELDGLSCAALGLGTGTLACRADCRGFDDSGCVPDDGSGSGSGSGCTPTTCAAIGLSCGTASDGCGGTLACGTCPQPPDPIVWTAIAAGGEHTCALRDDGSMWCFGRNNYKQLGAGGTPFGFDARPIRLETANDWTAVAAGDAHACGLRTDGRAWCWGRGDSGQLGNGNLVTTATPVQFTEPQDYPYGELSAGATHTCALRDGGTTSSCAGMIAGGFPASTPAYMGVFLQTIGSGGDSACGVTAAGVIRCELFEEPLTTNSAHTWRSIEPGDAFWCALTENNTLYCRGDGVWGQLGDGTSNSSATPRQVGPSIAWAQVSAGGRHACAIAMDSTLYCWGANESGQLGDTTITRRTSPSYVGTGWVRVSAGKDHTCGIKLDGTLWCWGEGTYGRLGTSSTTDATRPTAVTVP